MSLQIVIQPGHSMYCCTYDTGFTESLGRPSSDSRQRFCLWYHTEHVRYVSPPSLGVRWQWQRASYPELHHVGKNFSVWRAGEGEG